MRSWTGHSRPQSPPTQLKSPHRPQIQGESKKRRDQWNLCLLPLLGPDVRDEGLQATTGSIDSFGVLVFFKTVDGRSQRSTEKHELVRTMFRFCPVNSKDLTSDNSKPATHVRQADFKDVIVINEDMPFSCLGDTEE